MQQPNQTPEQTMMKFITAKWISRPLAVATDLGLADMIAEGSLSSRELAHRTKTSPEPLYRLLRALSGVGIFREEPGGRFANTPLSLCLRKGALLPVARMFLSPWHDAAWAELGAAVGSGKVPFEEAHGKEAFAWLSQNPRAGEVFNQANAAKSRAMGKELVGLGDFSQAKSICDVGGGTGALLAEILFANPGLSGCLAELPENLPQAESLLKQLGLEGRCRLAAGDFFKQELPPGHDIYLLCHVLHNWDDAACAEILRNCRRNMGPESRLWLVEYLLPPKNQFCPALFLDLEMMVMGRGRERSLPEYRQLLERCGFKPAGALPAASGFALLCGTPA